MTARMFHALCPLMLAVVSATSSTAADAACVPYGPVPGRQYIPNLFLSTMWTRYDSTQQVPLLVAHRGVWGEYDRKNVPENTMMAIDEAGKMRIEAVELDIHNIGTAVDRHSLFLLHDYTTGRTTDSGRGKHEWDPTKAGINSAYVNTAPAAEMNVYIDADHTKISSDATRAERAGNLDLRFIRPPAVSRMLIYNFSKSSEKQLGTFTVNNIPTIAYGEYIKTGQTVPSLYTALQRIGNQYPGMTVVLDLRHVEEVDAALETIDAVKTCDNKPGKDWIILKPFANIFPGGWDLEGQGTSVVGRYGARAYSYLWIPVMSNRLVKEGTPGEPSKIPGTGPDQSQLKIPTIDYFRNWLRAGRNLAGTELGGLPALQPVWDLQASLGWRNMTSWRPSDLRSSQAGWGFNWKDDGLGIYPTRITTIDDTVAKNGAVIAEDVPAYLASIAANPQKSIQRQQLLMSISAPVVAAKFVKYPSNIPARRSTIHRVVRHPQQQQAVH